MYYTPRTPPPCSSSPPPFLDSSPPSSPASSPGHFPIDATPRQLTHPLAACVKASKSPREYEKKPVRPIEYSETPEQVYSPKKRVRYNSQPWSPRDSPASNSGDRVTGYVDPWQRTEQHWEEKIDSLFQRGVGQLEMSDFGLTHISTRVKELGFFTVFSERSELTNASTDLLTSTLNNNATGRAYTRTATAPPPTSLATQRFFSRSTSSSAPLSFGSPREELQLFLAGNPITSLPRELFTLTKLTVLSLRKNRLEYIPPEIAQLVSLRELNVANNQIRYLPAEINRLQLKNLHLFPNPFIPRPTQRAPNSNLHTPLPPTIERIAPIITLRELCLRVLFTRSPTSKEYPIQTHHLLPLPNDSRSRTIPLHLRYDLDACLPEKCVVMPEETRRAQSDKRPTGLSTCRLPVHSSDNTESVFFRHVEEAMTWEVDIAGVHIGGEAPLLWRGCGYGCLDHLVEESRVNEENEAERAEVEAALQTWKPRANALEDAFDEDDE